MSTANQPRLRMKLNYRPVFPGPIEGYVVNFLRKNLWRVESTMTYEDVMQEAYIVFLRVQRKYEGSVEAPHFMALFKTSWANQFTNLANKDSELRETLSYDSSSSEEDGDPINYEAVGELDCAGGLLVALEQAPREVKEVIRLLVSAPIELLDLAHSAWKGSGKHVANGNNLINKALGRPHGYDSITPVEKYFAETAV